MQIRIELAIARAKELGYPVLKKELAEKLWPNSTETGQQVNMTRLCNGKGGTIRPEWVPIICEMCHCSADFLFGMTND